VVASHVRVKEEPQPWGGSRYREDHQHRGDKQLDVLAPTPHCAQL